MSQKIYRHLIDGIVLLILLSGITLICIAIHSFFVPQEYGLGTLLGFRHRITMLMASIFGITIAAGIACSVILWATRSIRIEEKSQT